MRTSGPRCACPDMYIHIEMSFTLMCWCPHACQLNMSFQLQKRMQTHFSCYASFGYRRNTSARLKNDCISTVVTTQQSPLGPYRLLLLIWHRRSNNTVWPDVSAVPKFNCMTDLYYSLQNHTAAKTLISMLHGRNWRLTSSQKPKIYQTVSAWTLSDVKDKLDQSEAKQDIFAWMFKNLYLRVYDLYAYT